VRVRRRYPVSASGSVVRCASIDTSGNYVFERLLVGPNRITVDCDGKELTRGKHIASITMTLDSAERRRVDFPTISAGCDPRPLRRVRGIFSGHYSSGFEHSEFIPCPDDVPFLPSDTAGKRPYRRRIWVHIPRGGRLVGWPAAPPEAKPVHAEDHAEYFVRFAGVLTGPWAYGHLGGSAFELTVDSVIEVRAPEPNICDAR